MTTQTRRTSRPLFQLPLQGQLAIGLLAILICWVTSLCVAHLIQHFNSSLGIAQL